MIKLGQRLKNSVVGMGMKYAPTAFTCTTYECFISSYNTSCST